MPTSPTLLVFFSQNANFTICYGADSNKFHYHLRKSQQRMRSVFVEIVQDSEWVRSAASSEAQRARIRSVCLLWAHTLWNCSFNPPFMTRIVTLISKCARNLILKRSIRRLEGIWPDSLPWARWPRWRCRHRSNTATQTENVGKSHHKNHPTTKVIVETHDQRADIWGGFFLQALLGRYGGCLQHAGGECLIS